MLHPYWQQLVDRSFETESEQIRFEVWTNQTSLDLDWNVWPVYITHHLHLHCTPCSNAAQFCIGQAWLCMSAATFASRVTTLSRRAAGALLFDGQLVSCAQPSCAEPHMKHDCCATSASPEEAKFKALWSCLFSADHFLFLYGKTGRSPGCAAVHRNKTNQPGYVATSVEWKTMSSVRLTTLMKNLQQLLRWCVFKKKNNKKEVLCLNSAPGSEVICLEKTLFCPLLSIFHLLPPLASPLAAHTLACQLLHASAPTSDLFSREGREQQVKGR